MFKLLSKNEIYEKVNFKVTKLVSFNCVNDKLSDKSWYSIPITKSITTQVHFHVTIGSSHIEWVIDTKGNLIGSLSQNINQKNTQENVLHKGIGSRNISPMINLLGKSWIRSDTLMNFV